MAYYDTINVVAGDTKPEVNLTLKDKNTAASGMTLDPDDSDTWEVIDLSGATVRVYFRALGGSEILDTLNCTLVSGGSGGQCFMVWNSDTLDVDAGTYEGEIEITFSDGNVLTIFDKLKFKVRADF